MKRKILFICFAITVFSLPALYSSVKSSRQAEIAKPTVIPSSSSEASQSDMDDYIVYRHLFAQIRAEGSTEGSTHRDANRAIQLYEHSVPLSEPEAEALERIRMGTMAISLTRSYRRPNIGLGHSNRASETYLSADRLGERPCREKCQRRS